MVMVSHGHSSADRQANGRPESAAQGSKERRSERPPQTPRKQTALSEQALQDPGLKDYRLGECLGKGAFGSVYKAFNWGTGEAVAIKQIKITDLPRSELRMIEAEIDLLKNLNHDNIVKYLGFVKSPDCLNIILEYCENGSLHSICKNFGKFPENLVGVYMAQILQGLLYLHDQGVIHRDIKGANILTTKDGKVKLADFGVSTSTLTSGDKEAQVVGTPYWMAPEVIQLSGATTASDIWSVGCTVIELLEGKPPYHKLAPMPALFAIVNDDHPPLPEGVSSAARDFLMQCFQKDPNLRVSARKLLKHAWIAGSRRADAVQSKPPANFNEAVEEVKQWNEALRSPNSGSLNVPRGKALTSLRNRNSGPLQTLHNGQQRPILITPSRGALIPLDKYRATAVSFRSPEAMGDDNWDNDFTTSISPSALKLPQFKPHDNFAGLFSSDKLKSFAHMDAAGESQSDNWDENFEGDLVTIKPPRRSPPEPESQELETIRPYTATPKVIAPPKPQDPRPGITRKRSTTLPQRQKAPGSQDPSNISSKFPPPVRPVTLFREKTVEDYSDLLVDSESVFDGRLSVLKEEMNQPPQLFHPSDLAHITKSQSVSGGSLRRQPTPRQDIRDHPFKPNSSLHLIQRYVEDERDEDFSDIMASEPAVSEKAESVADGDGPGAFMLHSKLSHNSWLGDEDDEDDPFASLEQGFDEMDLRANILRDKHARLSATVESLVSSFKINMPEDELADKAEQLLEVLFESPEAKGMIIGAHGMLPILELLETCSVKTPESLILSLLRVINTITFGAVDLLENLCFVGGIPVITKFTARQFSNDIRFEAAAFARQIYQASTLTLQMFVSSGGLNVLVEFLDEDFEDARELVLIGVNGIWNVFELQGPTPKNDFCRIFARSNILYPLSLVLNRVLDEDGEIPMLIQGRIVNIFYLFSQAENYVKEVVADKMTLKGVMKDLNRMSPNHQVTMLKFIKNLSMLSTTLEALHSANAIEYLIDLLNYNRRKNQPHFRESCNQIVNTLYNLCKLSKVRQEDAAVNGIIPLLMKIMSGDRPPKEFALPILCDMAHSGKVGRKYLWQNQGLQFYISLLADQYWQVTALDAIFIWIQEETARVEKNLLEGGFIEAIVRCFATPKASNFDYNLLEPLQKLLRISPPVAAALARHDMYDGILQKLLHKKTVIRLNMLRVVRSICDASESEDGGVNITSHPLFEAIEVLAKRDTAVLAGNMAKDLVRAARDRDARLEMSSQTSQGHGASRMRNRRQSSYPNNSLGLVSSPMTPTHGQRPATSSSNQMANFWGNGSREKIAEDLRSNPSAHTPRSPRRVAGGLLQLSGSHPDAKEEVYRPRSRDGGRAAVLPSSTSSSTTSRTSTMDAPRHTRRTSVDHPGKSRLPRTSLKSSRTSMAAPTIYNTRESGSREPILRGDTGPGLREASSRSAEAYAVSGRESRESVRSFASASSAGAVSSERRPLTSASRTQSDSGGRKRSDLILNSADVGARPKVRESGRLGGEARPSTRTGRPSLGGVGLVLNSRRRQRPDDTESK